MTNTNRTNKILSWLLCLAMVFTILPMNVFAAEPEASYQTVENGEWINGTLADALASVYENGTVKLMKDLTVSEDYTLQNVTLDMNGYDVSFVDFNNFEVFGTVNIVNNSNSESIISGDTYYVIVTNTDSNCVVENVSLLSEGITVSVGQNAIFEIKGINASIKSNDFRLFYVKGKLKIGRDVNINLGVDDRLFQIYEANEFTCVDLSERTDVEGMKFATPGYIFDLILPQNYIVKLSDGTLVSTDYVKTPGLVETNATITQCNHDTFSYNADENVLTQSCVCGHHSESVILPVLEDLIYDGTEKVIITTKTSGWNGTVPSVEYSENRCNVGTFTASITVGDKTATADYTILPKQIAKPTADTTEFVYNENEQTYAVAENDNYTVSGNKMTNAGSQTVTVSLKDKTNYEWADGTTDDVTFTFTIAQSGGEDDEETTVEAKWGTSEDELTKSGTLEAAIAEAQADSSIEYIQLQNDIESEGYVICSGTFIIDLNGKKVESDGYTFDIRNSGTEITFFDDDDGEVSTTNEDCSAVMVSGGAKIIIDGGKYKGPDAVYVVDSGSCATIIDGEFTSTELCSVFCYGTLVIEDGSFDAGTWAAVYSSGETIIKGGSFAKGKYGTFKYFGGTLDLSEYEDVEGISVTNRTFDEVAPDDGTIKLPDGYVFYDSDKKLAATLEHLETYTVGPYTLYVGGVAVTVKNMEDITKAINEQYGEGTASGSASYDPDTNTLKLTNFNVSKSYSWSNEHETEAAAIYYCGNNTLRLELSDNSVVTAENTIEADNCYALYSDSNIEISGEGSLTAIADDAAVYSVSMVAYGTITIISGSVECKSGIGNFSVGVWAESDIYVYGGTLVGIGNKTEAVASEEDAISCGLYSLENIIISESGNVKAKGGESESSYGVLAHKNADISGGTLEATGIAATTVTEEDYSYACGLRIAGDITISGGVLNLTGGTDCDGMFPNGDINIGGGKITIDVGYDGLFAWGDVSITEGEINIKAEYSGVDAGGEVTISGGEITIDVGDDGLYAVGNITISGGTLDITAASNGLESDGDTAITGGTVSIKADTEEEGDDPALFVLGKLTLGSRVKIKEPQGGKIAEITEGEETADDTNDDYTYNTIVDANGNFATDVKLVYYSGSGGGSSAATTYTVKFETNGGSEIESVKVTKNATVTEPEAPAKDGYTFDGWYTDKELTTAYSFDTKVTKAITLYAKWTENKVDDTDDKTDDKTDTPVWENPFTDVDEDDWYYENARYAVENGLFNGTTETTFAPNGIITRAMMVTVLYRAEGEPTVTGETTFEDVDESAYYAKAVVWGQQNGIIKGYSETVFAPDQNITREQIAAIMHRYAEYKGYDVESGENTNILSYDDFTQISEYAIASLQYAVGSGLMKGKTNTTLNPLDNATRAEIAAILHRFIEANE